MISEIDPQVKTRVVGIFIQGIWQLGWVIHSQHIIGKHGLDKLIGHAPTAGFGNIMDCDLSGRFLICINVMAAHGNGFSGVIAKNVIKLNIQVK
jgi:hypothetical protein